LSRVGSTTLFFIKGVWREKLLLFLLLLSLISIFISIAFSSINIGESERLFKYTLLFLNSFSLHIFGLFFTIKFIEKERRGVTLLPLTAGVSRKEYLLSVLLSQFLIISAISILFGVLGSVIYSIEVFEKLYMYTLSATMLIYLIYIISIFVNSIKATLYGIAIFFIGNSIDEFKIYVEFSREEEYLSIFTQLLQNLMPNFYIFDSNSYLLATGHFILYMTLLYLIGLYKFSRKGVTIES